MLTAHSSTPGSSGGAAGGSGQDPNEPRLEVSHLALVISDDDEFADDPHQIIPTEDAFALPFLPRQNLEGFNKGYLLPAEVTAFQGIYYHESGDVRPGYTGASLWDFPLDHQGHVASKLHSGVAAYSSYTGFVSTGIVYPNKRILTLRSTSTTTSTSLGWYHLLPVMVSGAACIISLWYQTFSWLNMTQEHSYPT